MKQVTPQNLPEAIKTFTIKRHSRPVDVVVSELTTIHQVLSTRTANFTARLHHFSRWEHQSRRFSPKPNTTG